MFVHQNRLRHLLRPEHYVDPQHYRREIEELFAPAWHFAICRDEVGAPGQFVTLDVVGVPVIIRNFDGEVRGVSQRVPASSRDSAERTGGPVRDAALPIPRMGVQRRRADRQDSRGQSVSALGSRELAPGARSDRPARAALFCRDQRRGTVAAVVAWDRCRMFWPKITPTLIGGTSIPGNLTIRAIGRCRSKTRWSRITSPRCTPNGWAGICRPKPIRTTHYWTVTRRSTMPGRHPRHGCGPNDI